MVLVRLDLVDIRYGRSVLAPNVTLHHCLVSASDDNGSGGTRCLTGSGNGVPPQEGGLRAFGRGRGGVIIVELYSGRVAASGSGRSYQLTVCGKTHTRDDSWTVCQAAAEPGQLIGEFL